MFAKLTGTIDSLGEEAAIVDVQGVGYLVYCSARTLAQLTVGQPASLMIETQVREDAITLYGFLKADEQRWFRLLQTVQGVGAKVALALLTVLSPADLPLAISRKDKASLTRAAGVGPKLAERIANELKDKVGDLPMPSDALVGAALRPTPGGAPAASGAAADALSALQNLGYKPAEAHAAVSAALSKLGEAAAVSDLIRAALKEAGNR
jgi:holliday junction DNA helicase RuvA